MNFVQNSVQTFGGFTKPPNPLWSLSSPWRLLSLLVASALMCLLLARHLSSPLRRLSRAAQRLAAGELDVRVAGQSHGQARRPLALEEILRQVVDDARFEAAEQAREIEFLECEPVRIQGDPRLLHSAIENVVRNALRHTPEHSTVEVALQRRGGRACVVVRDHGPGLPPQWLQRVFEPFVRVDAARDRQRGGHGVGLAIAKRVIQSHGGHIEARNHPEGGLQVECLPLE